MAIENLKAVKVTAECLYQEVQPLVQALILAEGRYGNSDQQVVDVVDEVIFRLAQDFISCNLNDQARQLDALFRDPDTLMGVVNIMKGMGCVPDFADLFREKIHDLIDRNTPELVSPFIQQTQLESIFSGVPNSLALLSDCPKDFFDSENIWHRMAKQIKHGFSPAELAQLKFKNPYEDVIYGELDFFRTWMGLGSIVPPDKYAVGGWMLSHILEEVPEFISRAANLK